MKDKNLAKKKRSKPYNTKKATASTSAAEIASFNIENKPTTVAPPTNSPAARIPAMFNNSQNTHISGGSFVMTTNNETSHRPSLKLLHKRVAPNAILNAGGRADEVRCHPGTREEVIGRIEKWGDAQDDHTAPMFWLSGPAGAGKSAIMQTVAERCEERGFPQANFFFFRGDPSRNHASPLIATLLHQIFLLYPSLRDLVANTLSDNPLIFDSTFEDQVEQLIIMPLRSIQQLPSTYRPFLLLVDGLDECDSETKRSQEQILRAFDKVLTRHNKACPFRVLVASRDESQIQVAFNKLSSQYLQLYLNDGYQPENDIRFFVNAQFDEVRKTHRLAHMLDVGWPSVDDVNYIVEKSSNQFIYAATVMRFILSSSASPAVSLKRVQGLTLSTKSPFSHLDAIYTYILSQVDDQDALKDILKAQILLKAVGEVSRRLHADLQRTLFDHPKTFTLMRLLGYFNQTYTPDIVHSHLEDLTPLMRYTFSELVFYHASMVDYLLDQSRSGDYFVDTAAFTYKIVPELWKLRNSDLETSLLFGFSVMSQLQKLPPGLMNSLPPLMKKILPWVPTSSELLRILTRIYNLCTCDDDVTNYRLALRLCIHQNTIDVNISPEWGVGPYGARYSLDNMKTVPFGDRYFYMARADQGVSPDPRMLAALHPQSDFDRRESASWLADLLHPMNTMYFATFNRSAYFDRNVWISWACSNNIPCEGLEGSLKPMLEGAFE